MPPTEPTLKVKLCAPFAPSVNVLPPAASVSTPPEAAEIAVPAAVATALPLIVNVLPEIAVIVVPEGNNVPLVITIPVYSPVVLATETVCVPPVIVPVTESKLVNDSLVALNEFPMIVTAPPPNVSVVPVPEAGTLP